MCDVDTLEELDDAQDTKLEEFFEQEENELEALEELEVSEDYSIEDSKLDWDEMDLPGEWEERAAEEPLTLTREVTEEIRENREHDIEELLENYRENLRDYGVENEQIENFIEQEREKINTEYESLDRGDDIFEMYQEPTDWKEIANSLSERVEEFTEDEKEVSELSSEINYDEIYEDINRETLEQGFENICIEEEPERLNSSLEKFEDSVWSNASLDEKKESMENLADYIRDIIPYDNPPQIEYYYNEDGGDFGAFNAESNTLRVNEYTLEDSKEAADTIAHELWHAYQYERAENPQSPLDYQYQYNFENYIKPEYGIEAYEEQLVEAEARAFAGQFKDKLEGIKRSEK